MKKGIELVLEAAHFGDVVADASLVITGEGRMDAQTLGGKTPIGVLQATRTVNTMVPVVAVCGAVDTDATEQLRHAGFADIIAVTPPDMDRATAMRPEIATKNITSALAKWLQTYSAKII